MELVRGVSVTNEATLSSLFNIFSFKAMCPLKLKLADQKDAVDHKLLT